MRLKSNTKWEQILQAAFQVVCDKGYYETKIDDVARRARVAKGTVYLYFKDKPDLYVGIVKWLIGQARAILHDVTDEPASAQEQLRMVFHRWTESILSRPGAVNLVLPRAVKEKGDILARFQEKVMPELKILVGEIAMLIRKGISQGEFRRVKPQLAALAFLNAFYSGLLGAVQELGVKSQPAEALDLFFYGISKRKEANGTG